MKLYAKEGEAPHHQSIIIDEDTGETVAVTYRDDDGSRGRLLAAAPELLAILEDGEKMLNNLTGDNLVIYARTFSALARAAIAKATQA